jgi:anti-sigma factor RsiW
MRDKARSKSPRELVFLVWECQDLGRPLDQHIDNRELNALVPSPSEAGQGISSLSPDAIREAEEHVRLCVDCSTKLSKYRRLVGRLSKVENPKTAPAGTACPKDADLDWLQVATGQCSELKANDLIMHAALCDHCGPLLRTAVSVADDLTAEEEKLLARLKAQSRSDRIRRLTWRTALFPLRTKWLVPVVALIMIVGLLATVSSKSSTRLSGPRFAELAATTHRQHVQGNLALDLLSDSQQTLNEWLKTRLQFALALPASPAGPGEDRPYRLEGVRLVRVGSTTSAYIAYRMQKGTASLMVTPDSAAVASGGVEVDFRKVNFHYATVEGYKVVTWSVHGLTYALVSDEGNSTQRSCMVCHSAMRDRDLSQTPTPLPAHENTLHLVLQ